ncbi:MAG: hypothetical protein ABIJ40_12895, partial [Bacteroidota bacterium]
EVVQSLTNGKQKSNYFAHLDPDLDKDSIPRQKDWRQLFGQTGASQGHLKKQGVEVGDLFLFFGLFQDAIVAQGKVKFKPLSRPKHIIWGWFQIESSLSVDEIDRSQFEWATYHPHFHRPYDRLNTIYFAKNTIRMSGLDQDNIPGAGVFPRFMNKLQLTEDESKPSIWKLPLWMFPTNGASTLSYHNNLDRWKKRDGYALLKTVGRGQEFVFNCTQHIDAIEWLNKLFIN